MLPVSLGREQHIHICTYKQSIYSLCVTNTDTHLTHATHTHTQDIPQPFLIEVVISAFLLCIRNHSGQPVITPLENKNGLINTYANTLLPRVKGELTMKATCACDMGLYNHPVMAEERLNGEGCEPQKLCMQCSDRRQNQAMPIINWKSQY